MGAWAYCDFCDCGLDKPQAFEVIAGKRLCPKCDHCAPIRQTKDDLIIELAERVEALEQAIERLQQKENA